jgi:hypothetical protein
LEEKVGMAGLDTDPLEQKRLPHDGQARCRVCASAAADAGHEWCPEVSGLVCRACCQRILLGDLGKVMAIALGVASGDEPSEGLGACAGCERGGQWLAQHALGLVGGDSLPS